MNGREIEHLISAIDENLLLSKNILRREIFGYFREHESEALAELRTDKRVTIPTSFGPFQMTLAELETLAA